MSKYGQFCPIARSLEILGDRWTLLIIRELLMGSRHFNELERGLPRISRALLASRLQLLQRDGLVDKQLLSSGRATTEYELTQAGRELYPVLSSLRKWGEAWAFGDPRPEELDPTLLMWRLRGQVQRDRLPESRVVAQFDFPRAAKGTFWLILTKGDVTLCLTDPGYEIDLLVTADLATLFKLWGGRIDFLEALNTKVTVEGMSSLVSALPHWFGWSAPVSSEQDVHALSTASHV